MPKINQSGFAAPLIIFLLIGLVVASGASAAYLINQSRTKENNSQSSPTPTTSSTPSPTPTITPTPKPKAVIPPTIKPTPTSTPKPAAPVSSTRAEPSSVSVSKKRSELDSLPTIKVYVPGNNKIFVSPSDGTVGIYGSFTSNNESFAEFTDSAEIKVKFADAYGRGIKSGWNRVHLQLKRGDDIVDAMNKNDIVLSIPVDIEITD